MLVGIRLAKAVQQIRTPQEASNSNKERTRKEDKTIGRAPWHCCNQPQLQTAPCSSFYYVSCWQSLDAWHAHGALVLSSLSSCFAVAIASFSFASQTKNQAFVVIHFC